jgi:ankyrin repeat protein
MSGNLHKDFFTAVTRGDTAAVKGIVKDHPEAIGWRYNDNGLEQPVLMNAYDTPMLKLLLELGADPDATDRTGKTRLVECGDGAENAALLLEYGADINKPTPQGLTPLMRAAFNKCDRVLQVLVERGADPSLKNKDGKTAEDIARERHFPDVADMLQAYAVSRAKPISLMRPLKLRK